MLADLSNNYPRTQSCPSQALLNIIKKNKINYSELAEKKKVGARGYNFSHGIARGGGGGDVLGLGVGTSRNEK